jgi:L-amino acid N-acyltransferase YncA
MESHNFKVEEFKVVDVNDLLNFFQKNFMDLDFYSKEEKELNLKLKDRSRFLNRISNEKIKVFVIKNINNEIIAFIEVEHKVAKSGSKYLHLNWIISDYRKYKGLGQKLINFIFDKFKNSEYIGIFSIVKSENARSILFHKRNGFEEVSMKNGNIIFKKIF